MNEQYIPPRYTLAPAGVVETSTGREITSNDSAAWDAYQEWLRAGNTPAPYAPAPVERDVDRSYYTRAGAAQQARRVAKMSDDEFIELLKKG